ncbi:hypothetical protein FB451DRAFT_1184851 [Mycena latifolia]|nr:hypothetical protein FB451DRAFT_1184851 [Mycena latifolia]
MAARSENTDKDKNTNRGEKKTAKVKFSLHKANPKAPRVARTLSSRVQQRAARPLTGGGANPKTIDKQRRARASNMAGALRGSRDALQPKNGDETLRLVHLRPISLCVANPFPVALIADASQMHKPTPESLKEPATPPPPFASLASLFSRPDLQPELDIILPQPPITVFFMLLFHPLTVSSARRPPAAPIYRPVRPLPRARFHEDCVAGTLAAANPVEIPRHAHIDHPTPGPLSSAVAHF